MTLADVESIRTAADVSSRASPAIAQPTTITSQIENDDVLVSAETFAQFTIYNAYVTIFLCVVGILACLVNLACLPGTKRHGPGVLHRDSAYYYLAGLNSFSLLYLVGRGVRFFTSTVTHPASYPYQWMVLYLDTYLGVPIRRIAVCFNALASLDRFLAVAFPLKSSLREFGERGTISLMAGLTLLLLVSFVHVPIGYEVVQVGVDAWRLGFTPVGLENRNTMHIISELTRYLFLYTPLLLAVVLNIGLVVALKKHTASLRNVRATQGGPVASKAKTTENFGSCETSFCQSHCTTENVRTVDTRVQRPNTMADTEPSISGKQWLGPPLNRNPKIAAEQGQASVRGPKNSSQDRHKEISRVTKLVLILTTTFVLMALPASLNYNLGAYLPDYGLHKREVNLFLVISLAGDLVTYLTQPAQLLVSLVYSGQFRNSCKSLLGLGLKRGGRSMWQTTALSGITTGVSLTADETVDKKM